ncbi:uncharacterized protein VTP21DRAFT_8155 [Calcarisporiella thermophila]|uniref:uncharacterized protein n=1 Tax=Calcarisporiella thermophila TaxID=911321 RepID=UPI003744A69C
MRTVSTVKCDCPFILRFRFSKAVNAYRVTSGNIEHNHPLEPEDIRFARRFRRPDPEIVQFAQNVVQFGGSVSLATRLVRSQIESIQAKDIHNALATITKREKGELSEIAALLTKLENTTEYTVKYVLENGKLQNIFWVRNSHISLADKCPEVVIADSTYHTNHFNLPCLVLVGIDENIKTFLMGIALLKRESTHAFMWALQQLISCLKRESTESIRTVISDSDPAFISAVRNVIPHAQHQLCSWHITKDIRVHLNRKVENYKDFAKELTKLFSIQTPDEFDKHYNEIIKAYPNTADYLQRWYNRREMWAEAFVSDYTNLGVRSTQRVEGQHAVLKRFTTIQASLSKLFDSFDILFNEQEKHRAFCLYQARNRRKLYPSHPFGNLEDKISEFAMEKLIEQYHRIEDFELVEKDGFYLICGKDKKYYPISYSSHISVCGCSSVKQFLLPCAHLFSFRKKQGKDMIYESEIAQRWFITPHRSTILESTEPSNFEQQSSKSLEAWKIAKMGFPKCVDDDVLFTLVSRAISTAQQLVQHLPVERAKQELNSFIARSEPVINTAGLYGSPGPIASIADPQEVVTKGRPKSNKRLKSQHEVKMRLCRGCKQTGHDLRNSPSRN